MLVGAVQRQRIVLVVEGVDGDQHWADVCLKGRRNDELELVTVNKTQDNTYKVLVGVEAGLQRPDQRILGDGCIEVNEVVDVHQWAGNAAKWALLGEESLAFVLVVATIVLSVVVVGLLLLLL